MELDETARSALYRVIAARRDVRDFRPGEVPADVLRRILGAAHAAPSVGFSQPWAFVVVRQRALRERIRENFLACRERESQRFEGVRREKYLAYKLEGILDADLNLCVCLDRRDDRPVLGATVQPDALTFSVCCAVQNLWLAARAEGIGVGWVSIVDEAALTEALALPTGVRPLAYLCVGYPVEFKDAPMLEETGWLPRRPLEELIHEERFRP